MKWLGVRWRFCFDRRLSRNRVCQCIATQIRQLSALHHLESNYADCSLHQKPFEEQTDKPTGLDKIPNFRVKPKLRPRPAMRQKNFVATGQKKLIALVASYEAKFRFFK